MRNLLDRLTSWFYIRRIYGTRCPEYNAECPCCKMWREHDELFR